ncbi:MAG TPA: DUF2933 domain-containing protein [Steroidobacteraceae bacterium]|nr:DUF2933 domain-containing protein [Steroidobacteraceae bacterium]
MPHNHGTSQSSNGLQKTSRYVFFGFVAVAAFYLLTEHRAHVIPFLPFVLLAACPLMHIFMHRGHKPGTRDDADSDTERSRRPPASGGHQH